MPVIDEKTPSAIANKEDCDNRPARCRVQTGFVWAILILGLLQAINSRYELNSDGISYIDVGEFWLKWDVANAVNGYWNPIYPILLALAWKLAGGFVGEAFAVHFVNVGALALNLFLFGKLLRHVRAMRSADDDGLNPKSERLFHAVVYLVFLWSHLGINGPFSITPDLLVTSSVLASALYLVRLLRDKKAIGSSVGLGVALGLGYLVKAIMFVAAPFFLLAAVFCASRLTKGVRNALIAGVTFAAVSAPYLVALSRQQGHLTYSESGKLAYFWMVNTSNPWFHWRGVEPGSGTPIHPTRQLSKELSIYEFGDRPGTYPVWFDPTYWHQGLKIKVDLRNQLKAINRNLQMYYTVFLQEAGSIVLLALFGIGASALLLSKERPGSKFWPLLIPAVAGPLIYLPVYALPRHLAPFAFLLYFAAAVITWPAARRQLSERAIVVLVACGMLPILLTAAGETVKENVFKRRENTVHQRAAAALRELGLQPGDRIAVLGRACDANFARLARFKIVAEGYREAGEIPAWARLPEAEIQAVQLLRNVGAKAIIRDTPPRFESTLDWKAIPNTDFAILFQE